MPDQAPKKSRPASWPIRRTAITNRSWRWTQRISQSSPKCPVPGVQQPVSLRGKGKWAAMSSYSTPEASQGRAGGATRRVDGTDPMRSTKSSGPDVHAKSDNRCCGMGSHGCPGSAADSAQVHRGNLGGPDVGSRDADLSDGHRKARLRYSSASRTTGPARVGVRRRPRWASSQGLSTGSSLSICVASNRTCERSMRLLVEVGKEMASAARGGHRGSPGAWCPLRWRRLGGRARSAGSGRRSMNPAASRSIRRRGGHDGAVDAEVLH